MVGKRAFRGNFEFSAARLPTLRQKIRLLSNAYVRQIKQRVRPFLKSLKKNG